MSKTPFILGQSDQCDVVISDLRVSRQHAKLIQENADYIIVDAGSRHGTFVNGAREERITLHHNDMLLEKLNRVPCGSRLKDRRKKT